MISVSAPAKVNLFLAVHPLDDSGYHPIESVVQVVDLADTVHLRPAGDRDLVEVVPMGAAPSGPDNLVATALVAARRSGVAVPPVDVLVEKVVPAEAGLGGGSADAAATIVGAAALAGLDAPDALLAAAATVGSDVPAMLLGGTVRVAGRGEQVAPMSPVDPTLRWLVVVPPFGLSTAAVYRAWDDLGGPVGEDVGWPATAAATGREPRNDLQPAAVHLEPRLVEWMGVVADLVGRRPMVSGSGSAFFVELDGPAPEGGRWQEQSRLWTSVGPRPSGPRVTSG